MTDMGAFRTTVLIENLARRGETRALTDVLVDTGSEYTSTPDFVVFAEPGDLAVLGAHSLEGLNLRVDPVRKILVDAGPIVAAAA